MDFESRLKQAIERGARAGQRSAEESARAAMSEEECKRLHSNYRLIVSEHIEACLRKLENHFPGFRFETIYGDRGWGAGVSRDDVQIERGGKRRENAYSRLEVSVRPYSSLHVLDLTAKGTVRNKEILHHVHYAPLDEADPNEFKDLVDKWVLEFAELYARMGV